MNSPRGYHSTAVLLPSGKVLSGGGEFGWLWLPTPTGGRCADYQVFVPPYLADGQNRPTILTAPQAPPPPNTMTLGQQVPPLNKYKVYYEYPWDDANVAKVVLMAPGATTHHSDMHQRYVECTVLGTGTDASGSYIEFYPPLRMGLASMVGSHAPPGYYMLFILTDNTGPAWLGVPSDAVWVQLQ